MTPTLPDFITTGLPVTGASFATHPLRPVYVYVLELLVSFDGLGCAVGVVDDEIDAQKWVIEDPDNRDYRRFVLNRLPRNEDL